MFRSQLFDHIQGVVLRASAVTTFSACLRRKQAEKVVIALARRTTP